MTSFHRLLVLPILCCAALVSTSLSQDIPDQQEEQGQSGRHAEKKYIIKLETTPHKQYCQASSSIEYFQSDDVATVTGEIRNEDCATSSGTFTMNVRFRDSDGELHDLEFEETWQREDDQSITFDREYVIGKNVDLVRVRTRRMKCVCAEIPSDDQNQDETKE